MTDKPDAGTIVVVEDEDAIRMGLRDSLELEGYLVDDATDGDTAIETILKVRPDLIILDLMLPGKDGYSVCRTIREQGCESFIIMLTAKKEEMDRIMGFNAGTDDYMVKPFSLMELIAKIKAVFRRINKDRESEDVYRMGRLEINFKKYEIFIDKKRTEASTKEFEILRYFTTHPNEVVSRENLLEAVWGYDVFPSTRTVDNFIVRLRQKLEKRPDQPQIIKSIRGVGYKFCPEAL